MMTKIKLYIYQVYLSCKNSIDNTWALFNPGYRYWRKGSLYYKTMTGKKLNYEHPQDINEKLLWMACCYQHPLIVQCVDKVKSA